MSYLKRILRDVKTLFTVAPNRLRDMIE